MTYYEKECLDWMKKRLLVEARQAAALERIADALERQPAAVEPDVDFETATWQDAILFLKDTCIQADECGHGCPMNEWCQTFNKEGSAPSKWEPIENDEEASK